MEGLRQPVGALPPEIYWRRRLAVLGGLALLVIVVWVLVTSPAGTTTPSASASGPAASATPDPSAAPAAQAIPCTADDLTITTTANPRDFGAGSLPVFDVQLENVGSAPCSVDTAAAGTELLITSGSDRIWSSADCPDESPINARSFLLDAGAQEAFQVTWSRQRSVESCTTVTAEPRPGTYRAALTIQGIESDVATFTLSE